MEQDLKKSDYVKWLIESIANAVTSYENDSHEIYHEIYFDYDDVISLLEQADALVEESARCPRPDNLPLDMPWSERMDDDEDFNPFVFDGTMSIDDHERMHELMEQSEQD
jgi:hypothetical protein